MLLRDRLPAIVALIAIGLLASLALQWPARGVDWMGLSLAVSGRDLLGLVLVGLVWVGVDTALGHHPQIQSGKAAVGPLSWVLPTAWIVAGWLILPFSGRLDVQLLGTAAVCALLALSTVGEYYVADPSAPWRVRVQFVLRLATYLAAMLLYTAIRLAMESRGAAAVAVAVASALLAWRLCAGDDRVVPGLQTLHIKALGALGGTALARWWVFAALGILLAASAWLFGLWTRPPLLAGPVLVVLLYLGVGLVKQFLLQRLTRRVVAEYLAVAVVALLLLSLVR